ncbi:MAG: hypothetical protein AB1430_17125 [Pseudomonadota bacterium]
MNEVVSALHRRLATGLLGIAVLLGNSTASASGWKPVFQSGSFVGAVKTADDGVLLSYSYPMTETPTAFLPFYDVQNQIYGPLRSKWNEIVYEKLSKLSEYRSHTSTVSGPVRLSYSRAASSGRLQLTTPTLGFTAKFHDRYWLIGVDCTVSMTTGPVSFTATDYISSTGVLVEPKLTFFPSNNVGCSTSLSWVPILGDILEDLVTDKVASAVTALQTTYKTEIEKKLPTAVFFGLPSIPRGKFIHNGLDYGAYIADNLSYLLASGDGFQVFVGDPAYRTPPAYGVVTTDRFSVTFPSGLSFSIYEKAKYMKTWVCDPGVPCQQP